MYKALIVVGTCALLGACATAQPVNKPCGIVDDALLEVQSKDAPGQHRLDRYFERGVSAKCWTRDGKLR